MTIYIAKALTACTALLLLALPVCAQDNGAAAVATVVTLQKESNATAGTKDEYDTDGSIASLRNTSSPISSQVALQQTQRVQALHSWKRLHNDDYSEIRFQSTFVPQSVSVRGNYATVTGSETVHVYLTVKDNGKRDFSAEKRALMEQLQRERRLYMPGDTIDSSYRVSHTYSLVQRAAGWRVIQDVSDEVLPVTPRSQPVPPSMLYGLLMPGGVPFGIPELSGTLNAPETFAARPAAARRLLRNGVTRYADTWCNEGPNKGHGYNRNYKTWKDNDTDCANFISQCYGDSSGGQLATTATWQPYFNTWVRARELYEFMKGYVGSINRDLMDYQTARDYQRRYLSPADLICYYQNKGHIVVVVALDSNGNCYYDGHTTDRFHNLWDAFTTTSDRYSMLHVQSQ